MSIDFEQPEPRKKESIIKKTRRFLFGDDIFISYSRADSTYALTLANELTKRKLSCFLDQWGTPPGEQLPEELIETVKRCSTMVLIGSKSAAESVNVGLEVQEFLTTKRPLIPITFVADETQSGSPEDLKPQDLKGTLEYAEWYPMIAGVAKTNEVLSALKTRKPSENVLLRIVNAVEFRSRSRRLRRMFFATLSAIALLLISGVTVVLWSVNEAEAAVDRAKEADNKRIEAEANAESAEQRRKDAQKDAEKARQDQAEAEGKLSKAEKSLEEKGRELTDANNNLKNTETQLTRTKKDLTTAQIRTKEEQARTRRAEAQRLVAEEETRRQEQEKKRFAAVNFFNTAQNYSASDNNRALLWTQEAIKTTPEEEKRNLFRTRLLQLTRYAKTDVFNTGIAPAADTLTVFSARGNKAIVLSNGVLKVFDLRERREIPLPGLARNSYKAISNDRFYRPIFSPDEKYIAFFALKAAADGSAGDRFHLEVWELEAAEKPKLSIPHAIFENRMVHSLRNLLFSENQSVTIDDKSDLPREMIWGFAPDSRSILVNTRRTTINNRVGNWIVGWNLDAPNLADGNIHIPNSGTSFAVSPDAAHNYIVASREIDGANVLHFTNLTDDTKKIRAVNAGRGKIQSVPFFDDKLLLTLARPDAEVKDKWIQELIVHDLATDKGSRHRLRTSARPLLTESFPAAPTDEALLIRGFSRNKLFFSKKNEIYALDLNDLKDDEPVNTSQPLITLKGSRFDRIRVSFSRDERHIITETVEAASDNPVWEINVWDAVTGAPVQPPVSRRYGKVVGENNLIITSPEEGLFETENLFSSVAKVDFKIEPALLKDEGLRAFDPVQRRYLVSDGKEFSVFAADDPSLNLKLPLKHYKDLPLKRYKQFSFSDDGTIISAILMTPFDVLIRWKRDPLTGRYEQLEPRELTGREALREIGAQQTATLYTGDYRYGIYPRATGRSFYLYEAAAGKKSADFNFTELKDSFLAFALLTRATSASLSPDGKEITAQLGARSYLIRSNGRRGTEIVDARDNFKVNFPFLPLEYNSERDYSSFKVSPDGRLILTEEKGALNLRDIRSGELLLPGIDFEDGSNFGFYADSRRFYVLTESGRVESWYIGSPDGQIPDWMSGMAGALTGRQLTGDSMQAQPVGRERYLDERADFLEKLNKAACRDEDARFVLETLNFLAPEESEKNPKPLAACPSSD